MKLKKIFFSMPVFVFVYSVGALSLSAQTCEVSAETRNFIRQGLCGQYSNEREYQYSGAECVLASFIERFEDSAVHLLALEACGFDELAREYEQALILTSDLMSAMTVCLGDRIDLPRDFSNLKLKLIRQHGPLVCSSNLRANVERQMPVWRSTVDTVADPMFWRNFLHGLGLEIDENQNITEIN